MTLFNRTNITTCMTSVSCIVDFNFLTGPKYCVCFAFKNPKPMKKASEGFICM